MRGVSVDAAVWDLVRDHVLVGDASVRCAGAACWVVEYGSEDLRIVIRRLHEPPVLWTRKGSSGGIHTLRSVLPPRPAMDRILAREAEERRHEERVKARIRFPDGWRFGDEPLPEHLEYVARRCFDEYRSQSAALALVKWLPAGKGTLTKDVPELFRSGAMVRALATVSEYARRRGAQRFVWFLRNREF